MKNQLTNLDVGEVSFVDKGAIGEKFTVLKCVTGSEGLDLENELIKDVQKSAIAESLKNLNDTEFVGMMGSLMSRYQEINKGGDNDMNEDMIKGIIKSALEETMGTVNKNFVAVNKSVDEIQKAFKDLQASKEATDGEEEEKKKAANAKDKAEEDAKEDSKVTKSITDLTNMVTKMAESMSVIGEVKKSVDTLTALKLDEVITDFSKRLEGVEETENASNQAKDKVTKSEDAPKVNFWKSILGPGMEEQE